MRTLRILASLQNLVITFENHPFGALVLILLAVAICVLTWILRRGRRGAWADGRLPSSPV